MVDLNDQMVEQSQQKAHILSVLFHLFLLNWAMKQAVIWFTFWGNLGNIHTGMTSRNVNVVMDGGSRREVISSSGIGAAILFSNYNWSCLICIL